MKRGLVIGVLLATTSTSAPANPWDLVPPTPPYKNLADELKATARPGQPSALNPTCAGMTGEQCIRSEQSTDNSRPTPVQPKVPTERDRK
jgi:hypothetical protein